MQFVILIIISTPRAHVVSTRAPEILWQDKLLIIEYKMLDAYASDMLESDHSIMNDRTFDVIGLSKFLNPEALLLWDECSSNLGRQNRTRYKAL